MEWVSVTRLTIALEVLEDTEITDTTHTVTTHMATILTAHTTVLVALMDTIHMAMV